MKIDRVDNEMIRLTKGAPDGPLVSSHLEYKEVIESVDEQPDGIYYIRRPLERVVVKHKLVPEQAEPEPPVDDLPEEEPPVEDPPAEEPPGGDLVRGQDNSPIAPLPLPTREMAQIDPAYGLAIELAMEPADSDAAVAWMRADYSRRQLFNADESCYLGVATDGWWWLYDAHTRQPIMPFRDPRKPQNALLAGSCEPIWHPTDPNRLYYHARNGGMHLSMVTIDRDAKALDDQVVADFTGRLPWADVARCWMKDEGAPSFDGRYWCLQAETRDFQIRGAFIYDLEAGKVLSTRDLTSRPDHSSMSASGRYAVLSGGDGTVAYDRGTFEPVRELHHRSEHSDLGLLPNGHDYYVSIDYQTNNCDVFCTDVDTGERKVLWTVYGNGGGGAFHFSAKAYHRPGVVCVSCYGGGSAQKWFNYKVFLFDVMTGGIVNLCHHRASGGGYNGEPHATLSPSGRSVLFNSNWGGAVIRAFALDVPDSAYG